MHSDLPVGRQVRVQMCAGCGQLFSARQVVGGKVRETPIQETSIPMTVRARALPGRDEWFYRSLNAAISLFSPQRAPFVARTGVAVFGLSLLLPLLVSSMIARPSSQTIVAAMSDLASAEVVGPMLINELPPLPDPIAHPAPFARAVEAAAQAVPLAPVRVAAVPIPVTAVPAAPNGSVVVVSWYGPGFYENRLPCHPWLKANGLPIQFLPDTWGVAHKSLPCGTMVTLTHGSRTVTVPVVDRGPYIAGREFDLSPRVKAELGCSDLCTVVMQIR